MEKKGFFQFVDGFIMKILGLLFMTFDHLGLFLQMHQNTYEIGHIFRCIGRLAFPIFIFLLVEGVRHTKHFGKYFLRLSVIAACFLIGQVFIYYVIDNSFTNMYSPMIDLLLVGLTLYLIKRKDKFSLLAILPIAFEITAFVVANVEYIQMYDIFWFPFFLRPAYSLFGLLLGLGFYFTKPVAVKIMNMSNNTNALVDTPYQRYAENIISAFIVIFLAVSFYILFLFTEMSYSTGSTQIYATLACIPLLFYSGQRGYNKKWFAHGAYAYMPLHILVIYLIFFLIYL